MPSDRNRESCSERNHPAYRFDRANQPPYPGSTREERYIDGYGYVTLETRAPRGENSAGGGGRGYGGSFEREYENFPSGATGGGSFRDRDAGLYSSAPSRRGVARQREGDLLRSTARTCLMRGMTSPNPHLHHLVSVGDPASSRAMDSAALRVAVSLARFFVRFSARPADVAGTRTIRRRPRRSGDARTREVDDRSRSLTPTTPMISVLVGPGEAGLVAAGEASEEGAVVEVEGNAEVGVEDDNRSQRLTLSLTSLIISILVGRAEAEVAVAGGALGEEEEEEETGKIPMKSLTAGEEGSRTQMERLSFFAGSALVIEAQNAAKQEQGLIENRM